MESKKWCFDILGDVSRTFEIPITNLNEPVSEHICVGYLLCRIADTVEDSPNLSTEEKIELLDMYRDVIQGNEDSQIFQNKATDSKPADPLEPAHWRLVENTEVVMDAFNGFSEDTRDSIGKYVLEMIDGMIDFVREHDGHINISEFDEFEEYCYYVAGTVGHMIVEVDIADPDDRIHRLAENYGLMLQSVNIAKDVHGDYNEEGNVYIPETILQKYDVDQDELLDEDNIEGTKLAIEEIIQYSQSKVPEAREYVEEMANRSRVEHMRSWAIPYYLAVATLRELKDNIDPSVREGGVKITRDEVANIVQRTRTLGVEDIKSVEEQIRDGKLK